MKPSECQQQDFSSYISPKVDKDDPDFLKKWKLTAMGADIQSPEFRAGMLYAIDKQNKAEFLRDAFHRNDYFDIARGTACLFHGWGNVQ